MAVPGAPAPRDSVGAVRGPGACIALPASPLRQPGAGLSRHRRQGCDRGRGRPGAARGLGLEDLEVLTIGHSAHTYERLVALLQGAGVTAVADVRTSPHSRRFPHFSRAALEARLRTDGLAYSFLGEELGGRPRDRRCYRDGVADYERMAATAGFQRGLARVIEGARKYRVALLCAEYDPLDCHRCLLVARALQERGVATGHILSDGRVASQSQIEDRLLAMSGRGEDDLFASRAERLASAYRERARKVAFAEPVPGASGQDVE